MFVRYSCGFIIVLIFVIKSKSKQYRQTVGNLAIVKTLMANVNVRHMAMSHTIFLNTILR